MKEFKKFNGTDWQTIQPKKYDLKEISGTPPFSFESDGRVLQDWSITGQTVQDGTPTPENPIMPSGCGERTGNLFDVVQYRANYIHGKACDDSGTEFTAEYNGYSTYMVPVVAGETYVLKGTTSKKIDTTNWLSRIYFLNSQKQFVSRSNSFTNFTTDSVYTFTIPDGITYIELQMCTELTYDDVMLVKGSTAPSSYIPYGYKLPILSNSTVTNIYLGEVETTRRIKKLMFDGTENWRIDSGRFILLINGLKTQGLRLTEFYCSSYQVISDGRAYADVPNNAIYTGNGGPYGVYICIHTDKYTTITSYKAYLAQQYSNGTPVTVWYVLAEPETGIVNEPLMKIGSYADEINLTNSGVNISTIEGNNTLTVNTTIQPSSMSIKKGLWKDCPLYEYTPYVSGIPPFTFKSDGQNLRDWSITGQTVQDGTPTPENPIMPSGCGERTANFWNFQPSVEQSGVTLTWNGAKIVFSGICTSSANLTKSITLSAGTYTIKANANRIPIVDDNSCIDVYKASPYLMAKVSNRNAINGTANLTLEEETTVTLRIRVQANTNYDGFTLEPMLNEGSTALPYEPYGYKLPLLSGSTPVDIYLGESQTTRRIKKLVLTGQEDWTEYTSDIDIYGLRIATYGSGVVGQGISSHFISAGSISSMLDNSFVSGTNYIYIKNTSAGSLTGWKTYLSQQYSAGTPVTIWYVLAEPETAIVNEPLMKIGDYADEISKTGTSMNIPTASGSNTLTVSTTVQPSEMTIESISQWIKQN